mmetsp:Transcript_20788/g.45246  ORF Transcript_20788/g.45246 Transcript_20788/m.45246 type:complete len:86 (-) Transcript_20788:286-543(-)
MYRRFGKKLAGKVSRNRIYLTIRNSTTGHVPYYYYIKLVATTITIHAAIEMMKPFPKFRYFRIWVMMQLNVGGRPTSPPKQSFIA